MCAVGIGGACQLVKVVVGIAGIGSAADGFGQHIAVGGHRHCYSSSYPQQLCNYGYVNCHNCSQGLICLMYSVLST